MKYPRLRLLAAAWAALAGAAAPAQDGGFGLAAAGCPMAHCDAAMSDRSATRAPASAGYARVLARPGGSNGGLGCVANLSIVACTFRSQEGQGANLAVFDAAGNRLWDDGGRLGDTAWMSVPLLGRDGTLIAADRHTVLRADPLGGRILWQSAKPDGGPAISPVLVGSDSSMVLIAAAAPDVPGNAAVSVWDAASGALLASRALVDEASGRSYITRNTVAVRGSRAYVLANAEVDPTDGRLFALDVCEAEACGGRGQWRVAWSWALPGPSGASPLLIGDTLYFDGRPARGGTTFYALRDRGDSPQRRWTRSFTSKVAVSAAADPRGGLWVHPVNVQSDALLRLDADTGATLQELRAQQLMGLGSAYAVSSAITVSSDAAGAVLLTLGLARVGGTGSQASYVASFDVSGTPAGTLRWRYAFGGSSAPDYTAGQFPVVVDAGGAARHVFAGVQSSVYVVGEP